MKLMIEILIIFLEICSDVLWVILLLIVSSEFREEVRKNLIEVFGDSVEEQITILKMESFKEALTHDEQIQCLDYALHRDCKVARDYVNSYLKTEEFWDRLVEGVNKKQLSGIEK